MVKLYHLFPVDCEDVIRRTVDPLLRRGILGIKENTVVKSSCERFNFVIEGKNLKYTCRLGAR